MVEEKQTLVRDLVDAIRVARDDDRIQALFLDLGEFAGGGLSKLQELRAAVGRLPQDHCTRVSFRCSGAASPPCARRW